VLRRKAHVERRAGRLVVKDERFEVSK
jgi:hypothetical protein